MKKFIKSHPYLAGGIIGYILGKGLQVFAKPKIHCITIDISDTKGEELTTPNNDKPENTTKPEGE